VIALARGETRRAQELLDRLLRYDPTFALTPSEESPRLRRALGDARARLGPQPSPRPSDLGTACGGGADTVVVARALPRGIEIMRFDGCQLAASATSLDGSADTLAAQLGGLVPGPTSVPTPRRSRWPSWTLAGSGLVLALTGTVLVALGARELDRLDHSPCGLSGTCAPSGYRAWETGQNVGWGLLVAGGIALTAGGVWGPAAGAGTVPGDGVAHACRDQRREVLSLTPNRRPVGG